jgi:tetratricopeptide (TPR) repeat protein
MKKASLESQMGLAECEVQDTEEMYWLRQNDDLQSRLELGSDLVAQYRYRDAVTVWEETIDKFQTDPGLYLRIGGAYLTIREFNKAHEAYEKYLALTGNEKTAAFQLAMWNYLKGEYREACIYLEKCVPCDGELLIAVIYWHCLCCLRLGEKMALLRYFRDDLDVGHHTAYCLGVSVLSGKMDIPQAVTLLDSGLNDLDFCIFAYGIYRMLEECEEKAEEILEQLLDRREMWPCISYLAAWNDSVSK